MVRRSVSVAWSEEAGADGREGTAVPVSAGEGGAAGTDARRSEPLAPVLHTHSQLPC